MNAMKYPSLLPQKKKKTAKNKVYKFSWIIPQVFHQFSYLPRLEVLAKFTKEDIA